MRICSGVLEIAEFVCSHGRGLAPHLKDSSSRCFTIVTNGNALQIFNVSYVISSYFIGKLQKFRCKGTNYDNAFSKYIVQMFFYPVLVNTPCSYRNDFPPFHIVVVWLLLLSTGKGRARQHY